MFKEEAVYDLTGKKADVSFLPILPEDLGEYDQQDKERALVVLQKVVPLVKEYLTSQFQVDFSDTDNPQFLFVELDQKAEFDHIRGIIYISNRYLKRLLELQPIGVHELIHYYADRLFDFRNINTYLIKGRKLGISIRFEKDDGEAVDGFGVFDEIIVMQLVHKICSVYNLYDFTSSEEPYLVEQHILFKYISQQLPLTVQIWNEDHTLAPTHITSIEQVLNILTKATFASLEGTNQELRYRNSGRLLRKLFEGKAIKSIAIATRRREPHEDLDSYHERVLQALVT